MRDRKKLDATIRMVDNLLKYCQASAAYEIIPYSFGLKNKSGGNETLYSTDIHLLSAIGKNEGISAQKLAVMYCRTKGSISQRLKHLEAKGLIARKTNRDNYKVIDLYITEKGKNAVSNHDKREELICAQLMKKLESCSGEELDKVGEVVAIAANYILELARTRRFF
jgi:DNA-binding MarR family transcriptional regulator